MAGLRFVPLAIKAMHFWGRGFASHPELSPTVTVRTQFRTKVTYGFDFFCSHFI
jgi:hypothetical protein